MTKTVGLFDFLAKAGVTLPEEVIHVEAWKRDVKLVGFTARERDLFEATQLRRANAKASNGATAKKPALDEPDYENFRGRLIAWHIVEDGARPFANDRGEEIIGNQPANVLQPLFAAALKLSKFSVEDVETLTKNSDLIPESEPSIASQGSPADQLAN